MGDPKTAAGRQATDTWDYIIVGAGSAGCVLADRLSEDRRTRILVLEAGGEDLNPFIRFPAGLPKINTRYNWRYTAEPDPSRHGIVEHWGGGKVIGGSSSINGLMWTRGNRDDYDEWAKLGATGWDYESVLPYFRRAEHFEGGADRYRGGRGPQSVSYLRVHHQMTDAFVSASEQVGHRFNPDYNGASQSGVGYTQLSQQRGWRDSTARSYLAAARRRPNVYLRKHATATSVLLRGNRAIGVEYVVGKQPARAFARGEVLVCTGALGSPKLLMLSGIGPAEELARHGITVAVGLPGVGKNLQEHPYATMIYDVNVPTLNRDLTPKRMLEHGLDFLVRGQGAVTTPAAHAVVFDRFDHAEGQPDYEIIFAPLALSGATSPGSDAGEGVTYRHDVNELRLMPVSTVMAMPSLSHPRGRGSVTLRSADPADKPLVSYSLLGDRQDVEGLMGVCRETRAIFAAPALKPYVTGERLPGNDVGTNEEWEQYLRTHSWRGEHPVGTCRMGTDEEAVVDPELRVRGVEGLRVVDASVMPRVISGHTNAPTIMLAERASDLVRAAATAG